MIAKSDTAQRRTGRIVLILAGFAVVLLWSVPRLMVWWRAGEVCPATVTGHGRTPLGIDWTITRSTCGGEVGEVWQVRVIAPNAVSQPIFDARGAPRPVSVEQIAEDQLKIALETVPAGQGEAAVIVHVDYKGRPADAPRYVDGKRVK